MDTPSVLNAETSVPDVVPHLTLQVVEQRDFNTNSIERDPGLRMQIWEYLVNQQDEIRRAYINAGPINLNIPSIQGPK